MSLEPVSLPAGESPADGGNSVDLDFWRAALEDAPALVELPVGAGLDARVPLAQHQSFDDVAVAVAGLLARYSPAGTALLTVGEAGAWRPVSVDLGDDPTVEVAAQRYRAAREAAAQHPVPIDVLAAEVGTCVSQVALSQDGTPWPWEDLPALEVALTSGEVHVRSIGQVSAAVGEHLRALLHGWYDELPLSKVAILSQAERARVVSTSTGPVFDLPRATVWDLVAEQVVRTPDAVALVDDGHSVSYRELDARVSVLAAELAATGVDPGALVGLCVQRSALMVIGLLAIMRSGAAYVPIDPSYPADRVAMMVEDAALTTVVTEAALVEQAAQGIERAVLVDVATPSAQAEAAARTTLHELAAQPAPDGLAYVIFTSGSTGRPKGVAIGHRALLNFVLSIGREPGIEAGDRLLAVTTLSFDIAGLELLVPLTVGASVVVADRDTVLDPAALANRIQMYDITLMQATPATWRMLLDWGWTGHRDLRVLCGGEALPAVLAGELQQLCGQLWNMYGPTETTIWSLATQLRPGDPVTIGTPIGNTNAFVVGRHRELLPDGVAGELLIGGLGLAEGYLHRPDLTAERFVDGGVIGLDDHAAHERLYRTGDLVRRRPDGCIEFLSRMDNQVKVRGFRIELGEIETVLDGRLDVARSVAVVVPDHANGTNRLVAYATPTSGTTRPEPAALRDYLADRLPAYMVPSGVVVLDAFPLTLNGKIDRKALPTPDQVSDENREVVRPRTELEGRLLQLWREVLGVSSLGVTDDVFELGAGSLTIARLYTRIATEFEVDLPVAAAFGAPTVEQVAALVERSAGGRVDTGEHKSLVPIRATGTRTPFFLVHGGAGTVLLFEPLARRLGEDQPVYAFQAAGLYGTTPPQRTVPDMAALYLDEMRSVQARGPYRIGGYCYGALVAFEMARQLDAAGERAELLVAFNGSSPSYLRRFRPLFDADGARTDAAGELVDRPMTARQRMRAMWVTRSSLAGFGRAFGLRAYGVLRGKAGHLAYQTRLHAAVLLRRPLPESLRESGAFQWLSVYAQNRYEPPRLRGDVVVVRAAGLYHRDDLGWGEHVTGSVDVVEVPGAQLTPRDSMKSAYVAPIAAAVSQRLAVLDAAGDAGRT